MNIFLWVLQVLLALHTAMGAVWKFSNSSAVVPSLSAIPQGVWLGLSVVELACAIGFVIPVVSKSAAVAVPIAALSIAAEMLAFCVIHLASGTGKPGELAYWIVVAAVCGFVAWGRHALAPV